MNEILTTGEMGQADAAAIAAGTSGPTLMERAGRAVADVVARRRQVGSRVLIMCGPGNNGGDGFVAARVLAMRGYAVRVHLLGALNGLRGDAAAAAASWDGDTRDLADAAPAEADIVVDAIFGAGLSRDVDGVAADVIARVAASGVPVVAVDVPSGVDGDSGQVRGIAAPAVETVTFFRLKPGHLLYPGRALCGRVRVADIGIADDVPARIGVRTWRNEPALFRGVFGPPAETGHKYGRGHALVLSGGIEGGGAARLAARAALRAGAGLVTVAAPADVLPAHAAALDAVMVRRCDGPADWQALLADRRRNAVVAGPAAGVGASTREAVAAALAAGAHCVLDADALTSFADDPTALRDLVAHRAGGARQGVVLTPHDGEFGKLVRALPDYSDSSSKLDRARSAAAALGAVVVLKGPDTVIAGPGGTAAINANGTPWLATAGSGDVLAGLVGALLAQSVPAFEAACAAVWLHGEAGTAVGPGLIAEDLPGAIPGVLKALFGA
ncbi:NAD(P)H-hydrate dehydratase [uncultured Alsobacter sp.]|uniref:NAD(P)H-hydrate dehydratase n=1 Tax=uncultured Alsobacter sp. TaxID=1748258 RepID=UPI0025D8ABFC|nr:NAD(P)H-hydrate dehydratase [uncultured Alsobacter sp.]